MIIPNIWKNKCSKPPFPPFPISVLARGKERSTTHQSNQRDKRPLLGGLSASANVNVQGRRSAAQVKLKKTITSTSQACGQWPNNVVTTFSNCLDSNKNVVAGPRNELTCDHKFVQTVRNLPVLHTIRCWHERWSTSKPSQILGTNQKRSREGPQSPIAILARTISWRVYTQAGKRKCATQMFNRSNRCLICFKSGTSTMNPGKESNQGEKLTCGTTMAVSRLLIPSQAVLVRAELPALTDCLNSNFSKRNGAASALWLGTREAHRVPGGFCGSCQSTHLLLKTCVANKPS